MISKGKIAQFRSVDLDTSSDDSLLVDKDGNIDADVGMQLISRRKVFGGGFLWEKSTDIIKLTMFWRTLLFLNMFASICSARLKQRISGVSY